MFTSQVRLPWWLGGVVSVLVLAAGPLAAQNAEERAWEASFTKGSALHNQGKYQEALPHLQKAMELAPRALGPGHLNTAVTCFNLGLAYHALGHHAKAEPLFLNSLKIREARLGKDDPEVAESLRALGHLYSDLGDNAKAEPVLLRCLQIQKARLGDNHLQVAQTLQNLGELYKGMGQYTRAEALHQRALRITEAQLGKEHPDTALRIECLASVYWRMGQYAKAEPLWQRCLRIRETQLGKDHHLVAQSLQNLALLYWSMREYAKAEPLYQRGIEIWESQLGKDHPKVADLLGNQANLYWSMGEYAKAEALHLRSLQIREAKLGKDHPDVALTLNNLAALYNKQDAYAKAEPLLLRSLKIWEDRFGSDHPEVSNPLLNLAILYQALERSDDALSAADRLRRFNRRHAARTLPVLAEHEQLTFLKENDEYEWNVALAIALEGKSRRATLLSAAWVLNGKGLAHQTLAERTLLARDAKNSTAAPLVEALTAVRRRLTALTLADPDHKNLAERQKEIARLNDRERELSRQLGQAVGRPTRDDPWTDLAEVRAALPRDAVLIEIARFQYFKAKGARYAAWIIPPAGQGEVALIDLGDAAKIDQAVQAVRDGFRAAQGSPTQKSVILEKGEADAEKDLQPALAALAKLILEPLAKHIADKPQWILSPDGGLWLVPWAALPLKDGSYAIEKHQITYVISGCDLAAPAFSGKVKHDPPLIIADPDFDIDPKQAAQLTAELLGNQAPINNGALASLDIPSGTRSAIGRVGRLPGTAAEAVAIKPKLETYAGEKPWVYRGKNGLEGIFKSFRSPKVMVLSTHGYFLTQEAKDSDRKDGQGPLQDKDGKTLENPLLHCGLLLAGCNERAKATATQEDGVLTGLEIVGCDLRGTELVVLSACETGLGQVRNGEGVAGLRQAFQLAGAQAVVASLWQVSDRDTAFLMSDFFDNLAKGKSKAEALREAQLARIKDHRDRDGAAHPFFWAAFTLTGK